MCDAVVAVSAILAVAVDAKLSAFVAKDAVTVILAGKPTVTFTSLPTFVTAVSISFEVPIICRSSVCKSTSCVPVSPSTVKLVAIPVNPEPSPTNVPLTCPRTSKLPEITALPVCSKLPVICCISF